MFDLFIPALRILKFPIAVLALHILLSLVFNDSYMGSWADIPMHLLGGISIGVSAYSLFMYLENKRVIVRLPSFFSLFLIVSITSLAAVLWEFLEFSGDHFYSLRLQAGLADTMLDMLLGLFGGALAGSYFTFIKRAHLN